jgi:hypothetical protein
VPASARRYFDEIVDGLTANALRAEEVNAATTAAVYARKAELTKDDSWREQGQVMLACAALARDQAKVVIARREASYRNKPEDTYGKAKGPTLWPDRYLTPVHEMDYWNTTYNEVAKLYH